MALLIVLALLLAFLWLLRRLTPGQAAVQGVVRVVGGVMLGARERLVVVEVADQWLLLGVAAGRVDHLYTMPRPADLPRAPSPPQPSPFAARLAELLPRRDRG
ncbi:MAG: flagellar biosynthetic protein FliO [Thiobacillaceae bacterium]|nr:flagellar biosynthetic protein FliO [Thiobacillaceae bacterium]MCX7673166.1 flagellar biosynthetic protein FliO [Thiobacillaceae bacterium]MDW8322749.1 flagellar biosynthetic protein FliO [Burkholderiales bacterium]